MTLTEMNGMIYFGIFKGFLKCGILKLSSTILPRCNLVSVTAFCPKILIKFSMLSRSIKFLI